MAEILHSQVKLTRAQRRRFERLTEAAEKTTQSDARFFERFPGRAHRVRLSSRAEVDQNRMLGGPQAEPKLRWFTAVKEIAPGVRCRLFVQNAPDVDTDMSEQQAQQVYDALAQTNSAKVRELEERIKAIVERRPR